MNINNLTLNIRIVSLGNNKGIDHIHKRLRNTLNNNQEKCSLFTFRRDYDCLIIVITTQNHNYLDGLFDIITTYYKKILKSLYNSTKELFFYEEYSLSIEIPTFLTERHLFISLMRINNIGYSFEFEPSYIKSYTHNLIKVTQHNRLHVFLLNNSFNLLLLIIGVSSPHHVRHQMVILELKMHECQEIIDIGCGNGSFLFNCALNFPKAKLTGIDSDTNEINTAKKATKKNHKNANILFKDNDILDTRNIKSDIVTLIEVIEHFNLNEVDMLFETIFKTIKAQILVLTTPNYEYNDYLKTNLNSFRHEDHKFEFTNQELISFTNTIGKKYNLKTLVLPIGFIKGNGSSISQMAIFYKSTT
ncbi:methyltransferase domain-containing protein [Pedobacter sp. NJ-S-72]